MPQDRLNVSMARGFIPKVTRRAKLAKVSRSAWIEQACHEKMAREIARFAIPGEALGQK